MKEINIESMLNLKKYTKFHSSGYVIEIYNKGQRKEIIYGNSQIKPEVKKCNSNTLYDIASLTKVYTAVLVYIAYEEKKINLEDTVYSIDSRFFYLKDVTIVDLLSHNQEIWTNGYLGNAKTKEEFYQILFSATVKENFPTYVDTHYIILSTLLEKVYNQDFNKLLEIKIFNKLMLEKTTTNPKGKNIASNNFETLNGKVIDFVKPGIIHDTKGRKAKELGITTGHASIFTTGRELLIFLKTFLDKTLLKSETIELMLSHTDKNKENVDILRKLVDKRDINEMYEEALKINPNLKVMKTYNKMGVRYYNYIDNLNDVPSICSNNTISFSGFTGPSFIIDFDNKIIIIVMCNVMHNTELNRIERKILIIL